MSTEKIYDEQIAPLISQVIKIAMDNKIPFLLDFCLESEKLEFVGCTSMMAQGVQSKAERYRAAHKIIMSGQQFESNCVADREKKTIYNPEYAHVRDLMENKP